MNRRLGLLFHWIMGHRYNVTLPELLKVVFSPRASSKTKAVVSGTRVVDHDLLEIKFRGLEYPFYYPREMPRKCLYTVIGESFYPDNWHFYEVEQTRVGPEDVVVDCGAAEGMFTYQVAKRCRKVYAVEPLPRFVQSMGSTFSGFDNVEIINTAVSNKKGEGVMCENGSSSFLNASGAGLPVKIDTMDSLFYEKGIDISYLKADIEGFEREMLEGAYNTIRRCSPKIAITTYHKVDHARWIIEYLKKINPSYRFRLKGFDHSVAGAPVPLMLHAWVE